MFNTAWTDLVLKVGGQILLAVLVILAITFGADPLPPKNNTEKMIASRSEEPAVTSQTAAKTNAAVKTNAAATAVVQKNAVVKPANIPKAETKSANASSQTNK